MSCFGTSLKVRAWRVSCRTDTCSRTRCRACDRCWTRNWCRCTNSASRRTNHSSWSTPCSTCGVIRCSSTRKLTSESFILAHLPLSWTAAINRIVLFQYRSQFPLQQPRTRHVLVFTFWDWKVHHLHRVRVSRISFISALKCSFNHRRCEFVCWRVNQCQLDGPDGRAVPSVRNARTAQGRARRLLATWTLWRRHARLRSRRIM